MNLRDRLKDKRRIVIKIGSSSLTHLDTKALDLIKLEILVRELSDIRNQGKDVILVSSGAIAVGAGTLKAGARTDMTLSMKQACAAVGQGRLMMIYQKLFAEYNQTAAQILMTRYTVADNLSRHNTYNTFHELLSLGVIPIVNENDTVSTSEIEFGDNDLLSAIVSSITEADLLVLLSDIKGLYTDDPHKNKNASFVSVVEKLDENFMHMGKKTTGSGIGTGGMSAKLRAAQIVTRSGADMVIASGSDFHNIHRIINGEDTGTLFLADAGEDFDLVDYLEDIEH